MCEQSKERWLTTEDVATALRVSKPTVMSWIKAGKLVSFSLPTAGKRRNYRILLRELIAFCKGNDVPLDVIYLGDESLADLVEKEMDALLERDGEAI